MDDILSQEEVDALLRGIEDGAVETEQVSEISGVKTFDFMGQEKIVRGRMPALDIANERLARNFRLSLSAALRRMVDITKVSVSITKFYDFMRSIPLPSSINVFRMEPFRGHGLLILDVPLIFNLVEFFFGGTGKGYFKPEGREFTPIEQKIIQKVVLMFFKDMEESWNPVHPVTLSYVRSETNPQFVTIVTPVDVVINVEFTIEIETKECKMFLCIPYSMIEPIKDKLYSAFSAENEDLDMKWIGRLKEQLMDIPVEVTGELGRTKYTVRQILDLKTGDVILLDRRTDDDIAVLLEGTPKFMGKFGIHRSAYAVKITRDIKPGG
ncbi:MAG TPA: flagellar motor switch protein FliM [Dissulfurispiraceae bacterium]|nr:flagellar motor switch protein FliM [Dissulfurispiraceae bacterium]